MDKYEYKLKLDQIKTLAAEGNYRTAAELADSINWRKVKNVNLLIKAGDIYSKTGRYDEAREVLLLAYDRSPIGRMIIYRLSEIAVKMQNFDEAEEYYEEFVEIAPHDNLKYILRYKISKAKGADYQTLIGILEELKDVEYTEEWAYELAYLYHQAGMSAQCIEACDELILWFGDGIYVERALELKMLYQPLTKSQEDKYRSFKQKKEDVKEVYPREEGRTQITIPAVEEHTGRFSTSNLQEELAKSMQQIMDATEKETVTDTMDNIKKMVEEIPYLQMPIETKEEVPEEVTTEEEIDASLKLNFKEMLSEDYDGQISMLVTEQSKEPQINGQMSIEDVLNEWERTRRAAETALEMAKQQRLETAKAKALQEAGEIMERLSDMIPKLDAGMKPSDLLKEEYLGELGAAAAGAGVELAQDAAGLPLSETERAGRIVAGMNQILQRQIDRLQAAGQQEEKKEAESGEPELLRKIKEAKPSFDEQIGLRPYVPDQFATGEISAGEKVLPEKEALPREETETGEPAEYPTGNGMAGAIEYPEETGAQEPAEYPVEPEAQKPAAYPMDAGAQEPAEYPAEPGIGSSAEYPAEPGVDSSAEYPVETGAQEYAEYPMEDGAIDAGSYPQEGMEEPAGFPAMDGGEEFAVREGENREQDDVTILARQMIEAEKKVEAGELEEEPEFTEEELEQAAREFAAGPLKGDTIPIPSVTTELPEIPLPEDVEEDAGKQDIRDIKPEDVAKVLDSQTENQDGKEKKKQPAKRPVITKLNEEQKSLFSYFVPVDGMEQQICRALTGVTEKFMEEPASSAGNLLIQGGSGCGKTVLATAFVKALQREVKHPNGKIGKIDAEALNRKDIPDLLKKIAGGCLIIEKAGEIDRETAVKLSLLLENDSSGLLVIMEDTRVGLNQALSRDEGFSKKFTEKIVIPVFTSDELVAFGKAYANDLDYEIDAMGILALYNRISNIQRLDHATTLTEVKDIIDQAIERAEKKSLKKAFSILTSRRYNEDDYILLREKDFEE